MELAEKKFIPLLIVDLDGTVRHGLDGLNSFINNPEEVVIIPSALQKMKEWKDNGGRIVAVSNQGGIACDYITQEQCNQIMVRTIELCNNIFDLMLYCPHHPDSPHSELRQCWCRKPSTGLIIAGIQDLCASYPDEYYPIFTMLMVGDREEDRLCAQNAGIKFIYAKDWRENEYIQ